MAVKVLTFSQLQVYNANRPRKWLCVLFGHRYGAVAKPLPIRVHGRETKHVIEMCVRCRATKVLGRW